MTTTETKPEAAAHIPSPTWMSSWVGYHLHRMEAVECEDDIALLMRFGASEVRKTFDGVPHALIYSHLIKQREHRASTRQITGKQAHLVDDLTQPGRSY